MSKPVAKRSATITRPTKPGTYGERVPGSGSNAGTIRFYRLTSAMIALRHQLATALGYVVRNPCSLGGANPITRFDCYESAELRTIGGVTAANHHHVHDTTHQFAALAALSPSSKVKPMPDGVKVLVWPEDVEKAAWAIDGGVGETEQEKPKKEAA
jgi:hypothetical protein